MPPEAADNLVVLGRQGRMARSGRRGLTVLAPAKINLNLLVGPRRPDGYHPVDSLVAKLSLYDRIDLRARDDGQLRLSCHGADCGPDEQNLALRAAGLAAGGRDVPGADIVLAKRIPPGRGLGGGSSDAAAVLIGLNELWQLGLGTEPLACLAGQLGSDVPMFLGPPTARATGRGERVEALTVGEFVAVLLLPNFACGTAAAYRAFDESPREMLPQLPAELLAGPPSSWRGRLVNQLAGAAQAARPELAHLRDKLAEKVSLPVCLTGSGSALFVLCDDRPEAAVVLAQVPTDLGLECVVVEKNAW